MFPQEEQQRREPSVAPGPGGGLSPSLGAAGHTASPHHRPSTDFSSLRHKISSRFCRGHGDSGPLSPYLYRAPPGPRPLHHGSRSPSRPKQDGPRTPTSPRHHCPTFLRPSRSISRFPPPRLSSRRSRISRHQKMGLDHRFFSPRAPSYVVLCDTSRFLCSLGHRFSS